MQCAVGKVSRSRHVELFSRSAVQNFLNSNKTKFNDYFLILKVFSEWAKQICICTEDRS